MQYYITLQYNTLHPKYSYTCDNGSTDSHPEVPPSEILHCSPEPPADVTPVASPSNFPQLCVQYEEVLQYVVL